MGEQPARPFAPPDHSDPAARDTLRVTPAPRRGDRVGWVRRNTAPGPRRTRDLENLGTVTAVTGHLVTIDLDTGGTVTRPGTEVYPRPDQ